MAYTGLLTLEMFKNVDLLVLHKIVEIMNWICCNKYVNSTGYLNDVLYCKNELKWVNKKEKASRWGILLIVTDVNIVTTNKD